MSSLSHFLDSAVNNVKAAIDEMRTNGHCYVPIKLQTHTDTHIKGWWAAHGPYVVNPGLKKMIYRIKQRRSDVGEAQG